MTDPIHLGLTGGIGSGKSTVARQLAELGAAIVDADAIAHELTTAAGLAMPLIAAAFGLTVLSPSGALDRASMRALIYADASARKRLEAIIHPLVRSETQRHAHLAASQGYPCIVFDIPLLVESSSWRQQLDQVLVVDCTPEVQISRVMARSQLTRPEIEQIIATQASRVHRLRAADCVIFNVARTLGELAQEIRQISHRFGLSSGSNLAFQEKTA
jgi:dephospho-CoA kinase